MDWEQWKEHMRRRMKCLDSEERRIEYLAQIHFLLNGRTVVQEFGFMEMEVGIGFRKVH